MSVRVILLVCGQRRVGMQYILAILAIFTGEFFLKNRVESELAENSNKNMLKGAVILTKHHNRGAAFNTGEKRPEIIKCMSVILTAAAAALFVCSFGLAGKKMMKWGLSLLLGGAFSNTYDRLKRGYVVDYFRFNVPVKKVRNLIFNVSDFCIMLGAVLVVLGESNN